MDFDVIGIGGGSKELLEIEGGVSGRQVILSRTSGGLNSQIPVLKKPPWILDSINNCSQEVQKIL